ncbi:MAG TPA: cache domain-containing protein [Polyangiaceae bacterium]|nr:cache domain-containing protein [Polyangiaceae bacterium]
MLTRETRHRSRWISLRFVVVAVIVALLSCNNSAPSKAPATQLQQQRFEYPQTHELVSLVDDAAKLVSTDGEGAFPKFRVEGSRWRHGDNYIFVLDPSGNMLVHPDAALEGKNTLGLKDVNGRPIIRGLLEAATEVPGKPQGFYHYQWPVPGGILPRWKSSYVKLVTAPSGKRFVVGSGVYDDRMEKAFVVDMVNNAAGQIEKNGKAAFPLLRDPTGPFLAKDAYVFVIDPNGVALVHPAFPFLEGRNLLDVHDTQGKLMIRDMLGTVKSSGFGWVDYMWPKPGDSVSTQKSTYVTKATIDGQWVLVGCGVYLADAPKAVATAPKMTAPELMALVRDGANVLAKRGEAAFPDFREKGSKWLHDDTYFFAWTMDGTRALHAADPALEGKNASDVKDVQGRPYGKMFLEVAASPSGEGWVHYMYPEPGDIFPTWKSVFMKRVTFPNGKQHLVGAGIYNMQMDKAFIVDVVDRASALVAERGKAAFAALRDKTGPFRFMDVYVFVDTPDGVEVVNPAQPSLEGTKILDLKDVKGTPVTRNNIAAAMKDGTAWTEYYWYKPGDNTPARKQAYVRKVQSGQETYIVGSGVYLGE